MNIIISPAKKMNVDTDTFPVEGLPFFREETEALCAVIRKMSLRQAKELWGCNDKLAELNFRRFAEMDLERNLTPAILSYEGLQYQHMAPSVMTEGALAYIQGHLKILSGFYGVLSPFDGVVPYRLEMQAKLSVDGKKDLYDFWGDKLCRRVSESDEVILNLASKEYSMAIEKHLSPEMRYITCTFGELQDGRIRQKGTFAKMARGEMVRFLAEHGIDKPERVREFEGLGYRFSEAYSSENEFVFLRKDCSAPLSAALC